MPKPTLRPPSPRQADVLAVFQARASARQPSPTYREIGDELGISSTNGVADHVEALIRKGYLRRGRVGAARTITLTSAGRRSQLDLLVVAARDALALLRDPGASPIADDASAGELARELIAAARTARIALNRAAGRGQGGGVVRRELVVILPTAALRPTGPLLAADGSGS